MKTLLALVKKDLTLEFRLKETLTSILFIALVLSTIVTAGLQQAMLEPQSVRKIFPALLWLVFIFSSTVSLGRSSEHETENRAFEGVILSGVSLSTVFIAKFLSNSILVLIGQVCVLICLPAICGVSIGAAWPQLFLISLGVVLAYSALATLLNGIASTSRLKNMLLPLILLPLLFPLFFCAIELSSDLIIGGKINYESFWLSLLIALDVVYFTLGFNLYSFAIKGH